jgi:hypothetical protein
MMVVSFRAANVLSLTVIIADLLLGGVFQHEETVPMIMEPASTVGFNGEDGH